MPKKQPTSVGYQYERIAPPSSLGDVPRFIKELFGGFFGRLFYIFTLVWKCGPIYLFLMSFIALFDGLMPLVGALLTREILNELQNVITSGTDNISFSAFLGTTTMALIIFFSIHKVLTKVITRISAAVNRLAGERVVRHVRLEIMRKAQSIDLASFDVPSFYEKLENANREAGNRPITILNSTFTVISTLISLIGYVAILWTALPLAAVVIALISFPSAIINFVYRSRTVSYMRRRSIDRRQMTYFSDLSVNKDLAKEIRIFNLGDELTERYDTVFHRYYKGLKSLIFRENVWQVVLAIVTSAISCVFLVLIAFGVFEGKYLIGDYSLYAGALSSITLQVGTLISTSATIYEGTLFINNLLFFLKEKPTVTPSVQPPLLPARGCHHTIELRNVGFAYPETTRFVLKDINLTLRPGETVALVGLNGAGKTTLIKLLTRLYDPTEGEILLDGKNIKEYDVKELYRLFGPIFQDFGKYAVSVADNIRFGNLSRGEMTDEGISAEIENASKRAGAHEAVQRLYAKYDTQLMRYFDPNGIELSGGQWQKISIARAFYSDADILILDEPTSALDALAEQEIFRRFDELRGDKTTIFVSHRLSSATVASKIVVLENGRVVEEGTHRTLMDANGLYAKLFRTQAQRYTEEADTH